jgi:hypothetical protein
MEMHTFRQHLREAVISATKAVKGVRKPKGYKTIAAKTIQGTTTPMRVGLRSGGFHPQVM